MADQMQPGRDPVETYEQLLEHPDKDRASVAVALDTFVKSVGSVVMWLNIALVGAIVLQVSMRYLLSENYPKLDEIQFWFYGMTTMVGMSYALVTDSHVRVDILHGALRRRTQRYIELIGLSLLLVPFLIVMIDLGTNFFLKSYEIDEGSAAPTGLQDLWILKFFLPLSFILIAIGVLARIIHDCHALIFRVDDPAEDAGKYGLAPVLGLIAVFMLIAYGLSGLVSDTNEKLVVFMFMTFIALLFTGFPVAWVLAGVGVLYCLVGYAFTFEELPLLFFTVPFPVQDIFGVQPAFSFLDYNKLGLVVQRVWSTMTNQVLVALPMFIFMGLMLDESGVAERLMGSMQRLLGRTPGGLAITVTLIGVILAASTGIIGASVVLLGVLSLPAMMAAKYAKPLATGTIASAGTLGILIPPSIMLVIMGDQMALSVGDLFMAALLPGLIIGALYIVYIAVISFAAPSLAPSPENPEPIDMQAVLDLALAILPPVILILMVLGSIFAGVTGPTEASGVGALGATLLWLVYSRLNGRPIQISTLANVAKSTFNTTAYIFAIFIGATCFSLVLRELGGDELIEHMIESAGLSPYMTVLLVLGFVFLLGFVLDWIEITLIVLPLTKVIIEGLDLGIPNFAEVDSSGAVISSGVANADLIWFVICVAVTLQTSFLTPPVGFALFYLKGVCPPEVRLVDIYKGVVPFVLLQLTGLLLVFSFPWLATWLPSIAYG